MTFPTYQVLFYVFAVMVIATSVMVITSRNPVRAVLFLVLTFFGSSVLWMMLQAEFLALVLIFVYVGAVMTLFLFVVMMLNIDMSAMREKFVRYLPFALLLILLLVGMLFIAFNAKHFLGANTMPTHYGPHYDNVGVIGQMLYTDYVYPFEIAAVILLVSIISAISLAFHGRKPGTKAQNIDQQHRVTKSDRLRIVKMKAEKR